MLSKKHCETCQSHIYRRGKQNIIHIQDLGRNTRESGVLNIVGFGHLALVGLVECICVQHNQAER